MRKIKWLRQFTKDYRRERSGRHDNSLDAKLSEIVGKLASDEALARHRFDHPFKGKWKDHRDCHVRPDVVLIYRKPDNETLELVRLGSHSELGW